jgi:REP element-mobilizing transposase RayT
MENTPERKSIRLKGHDYAQAGVYFTTICTKDKAFFFWDAGTAKHIGRPCLFDVGMAVDTAINNIPKIYDGVLVDKYNIMPNHVHLILQITSSGRTVAVPTIINQMKGYVTRIIGKSVWQGRFNDRIIRDEKEYLLIWKYIDENPLKWEDDRYYVP